MKLGFSKEKKSLSLIIHPSEINDTINFLEYLKNDNEGENFLISEVTRKMSSHVDPDKNLLLNIYGKYINFSIRLVNTFIQINKKMGGEVSSVEIILSQMEESIMAVN